MTEEIVEDRVGHEIDSFVRSLQSVRLDDERNERSVSICSPQISLAVLPMFSIVRSVRVYARIPLSVASSSLEGDIRHFHSGRRVDTDKVEPNNLTAGGWQALEFVLRHYRYREIQWYQWCSNEDHFPIIRVQSNLA